MAGYWTDEFSFVTGAIRKTDLAYLVLSNDAASGQKIPLTGLVQWEPEGWGDCGQVDWRAAGAAIVTRPLEQLIVVGEFGGALLLGGGDEHEERVASPDSSPDDRGPLRGVHRVGDTLFVVGMDRQVYRRDGVDRWSSFESGLVRNPDPKQISGFESIDGFSEQDLYAVGWEGEIWRCAAGRWQQEVSPVGQVLLDVCCAGDGFVYACARNGILLRGRGGVWDILDQDVMTESLWSLAWFDGNLFAASMDTVFVLGDDDLLQPVNMGNDRAETCYDLVVGAGMLWSIGAKDVMSYDGTQWTRID